MGFLRESRQGADSNELDGLATSKHLVKSRRRGIIPFQDQRDESHHQQDDKSVQPERLVVGNMGLLPRDITGRPGALVVAGMVVLVLHAVLRTGRRRGLRRASRTRMGRGRAHCGGSAGSSGSPGRASSSKSTRGISSTRSSGCRRCRNRRSRGSRAAETDPGLDTGFALVARVLVVLTLVADGQAWGRLLVGGGAELLGGHFALLQDLGTCLGASVAAPVAAAGGQHVALVVAAVEGADLAAGIGLHEAAQGDDGGAHAPGGLPGVLVVVGDAEADLTIDLEAAAGREEAERGRAHGIGGGEVDAAVVDALGVGAVGRATHGKVPFEEVLLQRGRVVVGRRRAGELGGFAN